MRHPSTVSKRMLAVVLAIAASSCAPLPAVHPTPAAPDRASGSINDVITMTELGRLDPSLSVMAAVEHARPWFLHPRGSVSMVSIDHSPPTDASILRNIPVGDVKEIRLLRAVTGTPPVAIRAGGLATVGDVILVVMATGRP